MRHGTLVAEKATFSQVESGTSSVTILAANGNRVGAIIANSDANNLFLRLDGGTAASGNYSVRLAQNERYEVPFAFNGQITGIWDMDGGGHANVTEFTYGDGA